MENLKKLSSFENLGELVGKTVMVSPAPLAPHNQAEKVVRITPTMIVTDRAKYLWANGCEWGGSGHAMVKI